MSSFYQDASLVMIPSGYKTGKVYSAVPTDGTGDLVFTRSNDTATRVGPNGLIEKVRTNLILYSQEFDNAYWVKSSGGVASAPVVTANAELAPDGTMTADRIVFNLNGGILITDFSLLNSAGFTTAAQENTTSIFLKTTDGTTKTIQITAPDGTSSLATVTGTYQRFTITSVGAAAASSLRIRLRGTVGTSDSASLAVWGAQFESGVATDYIPTTTAAVSVGPVSGLPRLDYLNSTCPRLILEGQRTNLAIFSEQLDNAAWTKTRSTITANNAVSPDGYTNADRITDTTFTANSCFIERLISSTIGTTYTFSAFLKAGTAPFMYIGLYDGANFNAIINASTGAISFTTAGATSTVTAYGNGWYRVSITRTITASASVYPYIGVCQLSNSITYNGTGAYTAQIWGAQYEAGAYATSYIPTLAASVTRGADAASKTGITSLIGQTEGTLFIDFDMTQTSDAHTPISIADGTSTTNFVLVYKLGTNVLSARIRVDGVDQASINSPVLASGRHKFAFAYKQNDLAFYVDGVLAGTSSSANIPAILSRLSISDIGGSTNVMFGGTLQALLFKTRLSNNALASLTTL